VEPFNLNIEVIRDDAEKLEVLSVENKCIKQNTLQDYDAQLRFFPIAVKTKRGRLHLMMTWG
jgi:hypothetical protein